jgi:predicted CopG family antitoxin
MGKTITITQETYDRLQELKQDEESFSDLVSRLTEREDPMAFAGSCPNLGEYVDETGSGLNDGLLGQ